MKLNTVVLMMDGNKNKKYNMKTLNEEFERFIILSKYNTKLTLSENLKKINLTEGPSPATTAREVETAFKSVEVLRTDLELSKTAGEISKLLELGPKEFEKELSKAFKEDLKNNVPKGELGPAAKEVSKVDLLRRISQESKNKGRALTADEVAVLKNEVRDANKLKAAKYRGKGPTPQEIKQADDATKQLPKDAKKWNWKRLSRWGLGLGLTGAAALLLWAKLHPEQPIPVDDTDITPSPSPTPLPVTSKYTVCPETFPIKQWCKNETIRKVQACLGMPAKYQTGNFGNITQGYLERKGLSGTEMTQDTVDKVCTGSTQTDNIDIETTDTQNTDF
jgi:hypothetical protein